MKHKGKIAVLAAAISVALLYLGLSVWKGEFFYCPRNSGCRGFGDLPIDPSPAFPLFLAGSVAAAVITFWVAFRVKPTQ